ncbi:MAG: carboxypeptidase-like regulatory domain-containing protein [Flavobacterium sp.]|uniref:alpha-2-macroglobulin family protein n=1 Tax=Flavobacterium sp. TaxID=239 RepID=UPI0022BEDEB1|nr:MG2 domain-containing protein [Flavobacterium sp.]MCZ8198053.1 carboxypeptidase-like regulatory domain-containing protein [Flavobacterium sp.]
MKNILYIILLFSSISFCQNSDKNWAQVIELENEDKIKSASEIVNDIYKKATRKNNEAEIIKCFFYQSKYLQRIDENAQSKIIDDLNSKIKKASVPSKAILYLVYAKCLEDYSNRYSYDLQKRTKTDSLATKNFLTWNHSDFYYEIEKAYKKSLENVSELKDIYLSKYEPIFDFLTIEKFKNTTLYDYIIDENINHYRKNGVSTMHGYIDKFYKQDLVGNTNEFLNLNIDTLSSESAKEIILLFKKLEERPTFEKQFNRIKFMNESFIGVNENYQKALNRLQKYAIDDFLLQKIQYEKAIYIRGLASKKRTTNYNLKAIEVLDSILSIKNNSNAFKLANVMKNQITSKSLTIQLQKYTYPNENTRAHIIYKNVDSLKISFYRIDAKTLHNIAYYYNYKFDKDSIYKSELSKNKLYKSSSYSVQNRNDFFEYSTEVLLPNLEAGSYLVCFESKGSDNLKNIQTFETISVTNFSLLANENESTVFYQVVDRKSGKPIENVTVKNKYFEVKTNQKGVASVDKRKFKSENTYYNYRDFIELHKNNDSITAYSGYVSNYDEYSKDKTENQKSKVEIYLDRAIYRPGQTVYYKGIAFQKNGVKSKIVSNLLAKVIITNADDDEIKEFDVTTNEFGSFSGEFVLPKTGLTGNYSIEIEEPDDTEKCSLYNKSKDFHPFWENADYREIFENSRIEFRVEEYKRPKFEVTFDKIKEDLVINQKIKVKGLAKAFSGSVLTNAKVNYTIDRNTYSYNDNYRDNEEELFEGEVTTDANGNFEIEFVAEPDEDADKKDLPVFSYVIKVDVTDINGETRSAQTIAKVGYHTLVLETYIPNRINLKEENKVTFNSTNLNDEFSATNGEIKIYFKKEFQTKFKKRVFAKPEIDGISAEEFEKLFPYELNEKDIITEELGELVYTKKVNTQTDKQLILDFINNYKSGYYTLVFSAFDKFNNLIENKREFEILDRRKPLSNKLFTVEKLNEFPKKDGFISLKIHSTVPEIHLFSSAVYKNLVFDEQNITIQNEIAYLKIPMKKEFESSIKIGLESIFDNQLFTETFDIYFVNEIEKIEIETETFRNKIEPGSSEFWSFKLKQKNGLSESEVLASMYDSSLDQFTKQDWRYLSINEYDYNYPRFRTNFCFENTNTHFKNLNTYSGNAKTRNEDNKLMWFGFDFTNTYSYYKSEEYKQQLTKKIKKPKNSNWISGYVMDSTGPLPGANVVVRGTERGVQTDFDGYYEIEVAPNEELVFSFIGMNNERIVVGEQIQYDITLEVDSGVSLEGVVVTAMGIKREKKSLGYAVRMVSSPDLAMSFGRDVLTELSGRVAGVQIVNGTGEASPKIVIRGNNSLTGNNNEVLYVVDGIIMSSTEVQNLNPNDILSVSVLKGVSATALYGTQGSNGVILVTTKKAVQELTQVKARKNLSETAFFLPHLKTDKSGKLSFNFTSPEALTEWKLRLLAHNKSAVSGYLEKSLVTQKDLMVTPNFPRFLREKDTITISTKIANITEKSKSGIAVLQLYDATTLESIDKVMLETNGIKNFTIPAFGNTTVSWKLIVPEGLQGVQYKVLAKSGTFSDGEENILPVLTNNMLVTESIPIWVRENSKKEYTFNNLKNNESTTLRNHQFVLEYTSNPTWLAIKSLPYLMEFEHGCAEQTFARFYSNALASEIIDSNTKIATVFTTWRNNNKSGSKLEENEELKSIILAETPWLNDTKNEDEKKKKLALLFDLEKMKNSQEAIFNTLKQMQKPSGAFSWFGGTYESEYITRHVLAGFGHLKKLSSKPDLKTKIAKISKNGIPYLDKKFLENNNRIDYYSKTNRLINWENHYSDYHYLYMRSFYLDDFPLSDTLRKVTNKQLEISKENWIKMSLYQKAQLAITLNRFGDSKTAKLILEGLKETASNNEDWGMYWIENKSGWYWYQAPIETQALLIEAFSEITNDTKSVDAMKVWLLKNKQDKNWPTTKATTEAVYALLMQGNDWLSVKDNTVFQIGNEKIMTKKLDENQKEAETGYVKLTWNANEIKKDMATIKIENKSKVPGFGGAYWQYFEDLDKIKNDNSGIMSVVKELYIKRKKPNGDILEKINSTNHLKIGDLVTVKLIITSKENMEFVHLKDMRASCFEPVNVLSENVYRDGLYYYMSTKDAATHFFFDTINKGTYIIEYDIRVNNSGNFSNGITTIQSMYAPEFSSHTKGIRVDVKN